MTDIGASNGLLRQYLPKGTNLAAHTEADLDAIAAELNARPRKTLDWTTPAQALDQLLSNWAVSRILDSSSCCRGQAAARAR